MALLCCSGLQFMGASSMICWGGLPWQCLLVERRRRGCCTGAHALLLCWCGITVVAGLVLSHGVSCVAGAAIGDLAVAVAVGVSRLVYLTGLLHLSSHLGETLCVWLLCHCWDQVARLLAGLRLSWISATVLLRPWTHVATTTAPAVVVTGKRARTAVL